VLAQPVQTTTSEMLQPNMKADQFQAHHLDTTMEEQFQVEITDTSQQGVVVQKSAKSYVS